MGANCRNQEQDCWALGHLGLQSICSGLEDFLLWVVLGREAQNNAQLVFSLSLFCLSTFEPLLLPTFFYL